MKRNIWSILLILILCGCSPQETTEQTKILVVISHKDESNFVSPSEQIDVLYTGVGKLNAATEVNRYFENRKNTNFKYIILNIGTCGSPNFPIGSMVIPKTIRQGDAYCEEDFWEYTSVYENSILQLDSYKNEQRADFALTSDQFIVTSSEIYQQFKDKLCIFDMEAYAVANYAANNKIPFFCIKWVSDNCDGNSKDWETIIDGIRPMLDKSISQFCSEILSKEN